MSDLMSEGPVIQKLMAIQVIELYQELNKKTKQMEDKQRVFGEAVVSLKDMVTYGMMQEIGYNLFEEGKKTKNA